MNFMFENFSEKENLVSCDDVIDGRGRFQISPMVDTMCRSTSPLDLLMRQDKDRCLISVGVNGSINNWAKGFGLSEKSLFDFLSETYLTKLRDRTAMLLIDYSLEGYQTDWLFRWFHDECSRLNIPPQAVVYTVGNMLVDSQYEDWADLRGITDRIKCLPYANFEEFIFIKSRSAAPKTTVDKHIEYKKTNKTWSFNCPQKRPRKHRNEFFTKMTESGILDKGLCSFPAKDHHILGETHDRDWGYYICRVHPDYCLKTFVTVVSEPQYYERELSTFTSEKVFKPISCRHPFIVLGGKGELDILKSRGYKTFSNWFDESYDTLADTERMDAIIDVLKYIDSIEDKISWFESMRTVLDHNRKQLVKNSSRPDVAITELEKYYKEYFNG
jgi:hypothetical protein